ncbi:hypothetical protein COCC4DRAFT_29801, partial [Bipolaris maydis ATCC 48331]
MYMSVWLTFVSKKVKIRYIQLQNLGILPPAPQRCRPLGFRWCARAWLRNVVWAANTYI